MRGHVSWVGVCCSHSRNKPSQPDLTSFLGEKKTKLLCVASEKKLKAEVMSKGLGVRVGRKRLSLARPEHSLEA